MDFLTIIIRSCSRRLWA